MSFTKLPALESFTCCNVCGPKPAVIPMDSQPHPGFGDAYLVRDDEALNEPTLEREDFTVQDAEDIAAGDPDHDWRLHIYGPLYDATYQRQGEAQWVLVQKGQGFA